MSSQMMLERQRHVRSFVRLVPADGSFCVFQCHFVCCWLLTSRSLVHLAALSNIISVKQLFNKVKERIGFFSGRSRVLVWCVATGPSILFVWTYPMSTVHCFVSCCWLLFCFRAYCLWSKLSHSFFFGQLPSRRCCCIVSSWAVVLQSCAYVLMFKHMESSESRMRVF